VNGVLRTVFVMVDGLGLGSPDPALNPIHRGACPHLESLLAREAVPIDAALGVPGLPQSATGQTALFTGINAAQAVGRHVEGFPGPALREIIRAHNLYDQLAALGLRSTFANAYYVADVADVETRRIQSVTTVSALKAFGTVRDTAQMLAGRAVYQDLTRSSLREKGYDGPLVTPEESARALLSIAGEYDFTLFEYFQTDRAGHKGKPEDVRRVLALFDAFLGIAASFGTRPGCLFVMTSDHGNIEEAGSPQHSINPVPFVAVGEGAAFLRERVRSITDVTPALVALYRMRCGD
jgi:hypothetical protein